MAKEEPTSVPVPTQPQEPAHEPGKERRRQLTEGDKKKIIAELGAPEAVVQNIADKYDLTPAEVFEIQAGK